MLPITCSPCRQIVIAATGAQHERKCIAGTPLNERCHLLPKIPRLHTLYCLKQIRVMMQGTWDMARMGQYFAIAALVLCLLVLITVLVRKVSQSWLHFCLCSTFPFRMPEFCIVDMKNARGLPKADHPFLEEQVTVVRRPSQLFNGHSRVQRSMQEHSLPQALRHHRTHSIESAPDDLLSPKSQIEEAKAATLLHMPIQNAFSLPLACEQPSSLASLLCWRV